MKKPLLKYSILFFFFLIVILNPVKISAQAKPAQRWVCLNVEWCIDRTAFQQGKVVPNQNCSPGGRNGHRVKLTAKTDAKPLPNKDTYVVECLATASGDVCTTGKAANDILIYGKDNSVALKTSDSYEFQGIFLPDGVTAASNPLKSFGNGDIGPVEWQSYSKSFTARKFFGLNYVDPTSDNNWLGQGGEQQGTFSFETQSNLKNCVSISWDPYGRVFDSQTLEPIPGASVSLLKKRDNGSYSLLNAGEILGGAITNPYSTDQNGLFSFVVPDATYQLSVTQPDYSFPANQANINSKYTKAYSDIYPSQTGSDIVQQGQVQHRDIPLDPKGQGKTYPVKLMEYFYNLDKATNTILIEGLVSHPLTKIQLYTLQTPSSSQSPVRGRLLKTLRADTFGKFKTEIDQMQFAPTEIFGDIVLEKTDLTSSSIQTNNTLIDRMLSFISGKTLKVEAAQSATSTIRLNPILGKIQGYAYNTNQQIIPNATVGVYLTYASKPYTETKTDQKGFYAIDSNRLPSSSYTIKYVPIQGIPAAVSTTKFIAQNNTYLSQNNINLNTGDAKLSPIVAAQQRTAIRTPTGTNFVSSAQPIVRQTGSGQKSSAGSSFMLIIVILILLLGGVGALLGMYLMKKKQSQQTY